MTSTNLDSILDSIIGSYDGDSGDVDDIEYYETELKDLQKEYLNLINNVLPDLALERNFPIKYNHCFGRVCLDNLFNDCWYKHLQQGKGSAYKQLTIEQLHVVINIAKSITKDVSYLIELNNKSLAWRKQTN